MALLSSQVGCDEQDASLRYPGRIQLEVLNWHDTNPGRREQPECFHDNHTPAGTLVPTAIRTYMPHAGRPFA